MKKSLPDILTKEEQKRLLEQFNLRYITPQRNRAMIKLLLDTGLRLAEMTSLQWKHIDLISGSLKVVNGKGAKDRVLFINSDLIEELKAWKTRQFKEWGSSDLVFTTRTLKSLDGKAVRKTIKTYTKKAEINKDISTHNLRHTFASDLLRANKNIRIVQKALGHSDISTTQIYTHIVDEELEQAMKTLRD